MDLMHDLRFWANQFGAMLTAAAHVLFPKRHRTRSCALHEWLLKPAILLLLDATRWYVTALFGPMRLDAPQADAGFVHG